MTTSKAPAPGRSFDNGAHNYDGTRKNDGRLECDDIPDDDDTKLFRRIHILCRNRNSSVQIAGAATWTEPSFLGWIETTRDALLILEVARRGFIPRVRRQLDLERQTIQSGSVFVFDEAESGIIRWSDGLSWSPSRKLGNFLLYRETYEVNVGQRDASSYSPASDEQMHYNVDGVNPESQTLNQPKVQVKSSQMDVDRHRDRTIMGSLTNRYKFKPDGLMKKVSPYTYC